MNEDIAVLKAALGALENVLKHRPVNELLEWGIYDSINGLRDLITRMEIEHAQNMSYQDLVNPIAPAMREPGMADEAYFAYRAKWAKAGVELTDNDANSFIAGYQAAYTRPVPAGVVAEWNPDAVLARIQTMECDHKVGATNSRTKADEWEACYALLFKHLQEIVKAHAQPAAVRVRCAHKNKGMTEVGVYCPDCGEYLHD